MMARMITDCGHRACCSWRWSGSPSMVRRSGSRSSAPGPRAQRALFGYTVPTAVWLAAAWIVSRLVDGLLWDQLSRSGLGRAVPRLVRDALTLIVFMAAIGGILANVFGYPLTGFFAASSVMALVIGLALRNVILDIFTGLAINLDRSYQIDDWIEVHHRDFKESVSGRVVDINWRTTRIEREDAKTVVIPNNLMSMFVTTNYSKPDRLARFDVAIPLDFAIPTDRAMRLLLGGVMAAIGPRGPVAQPAPERPGRRRRRARRRVPGALLHPHGPGAAQHRAQQRAEVGPRPPGDRRRRARLSEGGRVPRPHAGARPGLDVDRGPARAAPEGRPARAHARAGGTRRCSPSGWTARHFRPGEPLIRPGEPGRSMFMLAEGLVEIAGRAEGGGPAARRRARAIPATRSARCRS